MKPTLENILSNNDNQEVLNFLDISVNGQHELTTFKDKNFFSHEGLESFLDIDLPPKSKFILANKGIIVIPETGEIIAFQFDRHETAFKIIEPNRFRKNYKHIKKGLFRNLKFRSSSKVSLGYFSNVYNDSDTIVDIRLLGSNWALSIYFDGQEEELIQEFYNRRTNKLVLKIENDKLHLENTNTGDTIAVTSPMGNRFSEFRRISKNCNIIKEDEDNFPLDKEGSKANIYCLDDKLEVKWKIEIPFEKDGFPNPIQWNNELRETKTPDGYLTLENVNNNKVFTCASLKGFSVTVEYITGRTINTEFTK